jgi:glycosyltransferase involved in cell wall biosynthesis
MVRTTAVIPTTGRPELRRAVESVVRQTRRTDIVVVLDRPDRFEQTVDLLKGLPVELITTAGRAGGGAARNMGVNAAQTEFVAFLDDDDEWLPEKTALQEDAHDSSAKPTVVLSLAHLIGRETKVVPEHPYSSGSVADYLLDRSTVRLRRNFMQSSTVHVTSDLAKRLPWDESLPKHQDWDFLIRLQAGGAEFKTIAEPLVRVFQATDGSISKTSNWQASRAWADALGAGLSKRSKGDFLASIVLRGAISQKEWGSAARQLAGAVSSGCHPAALIVGLSAVRELRK